MTLTSKAVILCSYFGPFLRFCWTHCHQILTQGSVGQGLLLTKKILSILNVRPTWNRYAGHHFARKMSLTITCEVRHLGWRFWHLDHSPHRVTWLPAMPLVIMHKTERVISEDSPWCNIGQGYHWEGLFESYIIRKLEIFRFQIQLIAISNFQRKCSSEHFSKMADIR